MKNAAPKNLLPTAHIFRPQDRQKYGTDNCGIKHPHLRGGAPAPAGKRVFRVVGVLRTPQESVADNSKGHRETRNQQLSNKEPNRYYYYFLVERISSPDRLSAHDSETTARHEETIAITINTKRPPYQCSWSCEYYVTGDSSHARQHAIIFNKPRMFKHRCSRCRHDRFSRTL